MIVDTCVNNVRQVLALGNSGAGLPLHKSEKTENYCSVTAIYFILFSFLEKPFKARFKFIYTVYMS
jgi:hypothetical protein